MKSKEPPSTHLSLHPLSIAAAARAAEPPQFTDLHLAAKTGRLDDMVAALDSGDAIDAQDPVDKITPLHYAAINRQEPAVALLLERGADVNIVDVMGSSPLMYAIHAREERIAYRLLEAGADTRIANAMSTTAESLAAYNSDLLAAVRRAGLMELVELGTQGEPLRAPL